MAFWTSRTRRNTTRTCAVDTRRPPSSHTMASMMLTSTSMVAPRASSTSPSGATGEIAARLPPSLRAIVIPRDAGALYENRRVTRRAMTTARAAPKPPGYLIHVIGNRYSASGPFSGRRVAPGVARSSGPRQNPIDSGFVARSPLHVSRPPRTLR